MRLRATFLIGAFCLTALPLAAEAVPTAATPGLSTGGEIVQVAGGCGWRAHPNRWGRCVPNRRGYYAPPPPRAYGRPYGEYRPYRGGGPGDGVANQLNRQELDRGYPGR